MRVKNRNVDGLIVEDADQEAVECVLGADPESADGRSQWVWIRFPDGDLVLSLYPQGDTYFEAWEGQQNREQGTA